MKLRGGMLLARALKEKGYWNAGTGVTVDSSDGLNRKAVVTDLPMEVK